MSFRYSTTLFVTMVLSVLAACGGGKKEIITSIGCNTDADCDVAAGEEPDCSVAGTGKCDVKKHVCVFQPKCTSDQKCSNKICCSKHADESCECNGVRNCNGKCEPHCAAGLACSSSGSCCDPKVGQTCPGNDGVCGGVYLCNGTCSVTAPEHLTEKCNECGGIITCSGCSTSAPQNVGDTCNACRGKWQCDGSCLPAEPENLGRTCGTCGGTFQCDGSCSKNGSPDTVSDGPLDSAFGCGLSYNVLLGGKNCGDRATRVRPQGHKIAGGDNSDCSLVEFDGLMWANEVCARDPNRKVGNSTLREACDKYFAGGATPTNDKTDCRYIVHFGTSWCEGVTCSVSHDVNVCP